MTEVDIILFLRRIVPFSVLNDDDLKQIAATMERQLFPPKTTIIRQGYSGQNFYVIVTGLARVSFSDEDGTDTVVGFLGEGDCFGEMSLITGELTTAGIETLEETICLVQRGDAFLQMTRLYPDFLSFFNQLLAQRMRTVYRSLLRENPGINSIEPYLYTRHVRDMVSVPDAFIGEDTTIKEAAEKSVGKRLEALVVLNVAKEPTGIIGLDTIVKAVLLGAYHPEDSVKAVMERKFYEIDGERYFFDALHRMIKYRTNLLVVKAPEGVIGILTVSDLLRFRGREVLCLIRNIEEAENPVQLGSMRKEVGKVLRILVSDGAPASEICRIVSELNDKIVTKVIWFAEEECGKPPCDYAWLGLGSEGRREQTLFTDQDNAIVFSSHPSKGCRDYFRRLSSLVVNGLQGCGIPLCKGNVMATNPKFFGSLQDWKDRTTRWIVNPTPDEKDLMDSYVFLDFRTIYGDRSLERELRGHLMKHAQRHQSFLKLLAESIVSIPIPIGFFRHFIVEKNGRYKDRLNIKLHGLVPITTCVKILALLEGITETNTMERIKGLAQRGTFSPDRKETLEQAFETFLTMKIRTSLADIGQTDALGNYINPAHLSIRQKQLLKEAFREVSELQKITKEALRVEEERF